MFPISATAHYTGAVWYQNDLLSDGLQTRRGLVYYTLGRPINWLVDQWPGALSLERYLLSRHQAIDGVLHRLILRYGITQIVELACGFSGRGLRFCRQYPNLLYHETDLQLVIQNKLKRLARAKQMESNLFLSTVDILKPSGVYSLTNLVDRLDPDRPTLFLTEGLIGYLQEAELLLLWQRITALRSRFPDLHFVSDVPFNEEAQRGSVGRGRKILGLLFQISPALPVCNREHLNTLLSDLAITEYEVDEFEAGKGGGQWRGCRIVHFSAGMGGQALVSAGSKNSEVRV